MCELYMHAGLRKSSHNLGWLTDPYLCLQGNEGISPCLATHVL